MSNFKVGDIVIICTPFYNDDNSKLAVITSHGGLNSDGHKFWYVDIEGKKYPYYCGFLKKATKLHLALK